jgi:hypothetical protein
MNEDGGSPAIGCAPQRPANQGNAYIATMGAALGSANTESIILVRRLNHLDVSKICHC